MRDLFTEKNGLIVVFILAVLFPLIAPNNYYIHVMTTVFIWSIAVYGLNLLAGYTGQLSLAHAGFFAIGAYSVGVLTVNYELNFWIALALALVITTFIGLLVGLIALRTKEHYFAIYTLCVGYIIYLLIYKMDGLTGGVRGLIGIPNPDPIGPIRFDTPFSKYYLVLFFLIVVIFLMRRIVRSLIGRTFIAIRNSEELAHTIGIDTVKNKLLSFVLSTYIAGLAGALYASFTRFIGPDIAYTNVTFEMVMFLLVGGLGTLSGPVVGTMLITWLSQYMQFLESYRMLIFGPLIVIIIIYYPRGIVGGIQDWIVKRNIKKNNKSKGLQANEISDEEDG